VSQRIEDSGRRFRIFLANRAIALGWALKGSCKGCAHCLFAAARWLVPEAERFLILRTAPHNHAWRKFDFADIGILSSHIQALRMAAGFLVVLVLLGALELVTRASAISTQPLARDQAFQLESQVASKNEGQSIRNFSKPTPNPVRVSTRQSEAVPLPTRKLRAASQKRMAQQKSARSKPMR
jgi:hypothetical protein